MINKYFATIISLWILAFSANLFAQDSIHVMAYNIYRYPSANPQQRELILKEILSEAQPDILMVGELESEIGANRILNSSFTYTNDSFARATFIYNQSVDDDTLQQMLFYNTKKFILIDEEVLPTTVRDINHYILLLNTVDKQIDSTVIHVFAAHLKSSTGTANVNLRYGMIDTFVKRLNQIPSHHFVFFGGDMNFYRSSELGYQHIIDTNRVNVMVDPLGPMNGTWQDNANYAFAHTQSTRISTAGFGLYGAAGGVDDRFDFIFMNKRLEDTTHTLSYIPNSYVAFGNNGNCLNLAIKDTACSGFYSQQLREHLHNVSDHLPVRLSLWNKKEYSISPSDSFTDSTNVGIIEYNHPTFSIMGSNIVKSVLYFKWQMANHNALAYKPFFTVYNTMGVEVAKMSINMPKGMGEFSVLNLPNGMYYIKTSWGSLLKFVKQ
jgi:endonuclease/exonuclease/phosphatase family metal-dependent hydrolase